MPNTSVVEDDRNPQILITVHGIRTFGQWQERLAAMVAGAAPQIKVYNYKYGYFSILAFLVPLTRWLVVRRFRRTLEGLVDRNPSATLDIVAHSFGTHVVSWALHGIPPHERPQVRLLILAGSVLKSHFPWADLIEAGTVRTLVNECGINDSVLLLNQVAVLFTGMAGRIGFAGLTSSSFYNSFHAFGHSGYFQAHGSASDDFMQSRWLPAILTGQPPLLVDARAPSGALSGILLFALQNAEPIKLGVYIAPFALLTLTFAYLYAGALSRQLAFASRVHLVDRLDLSVLAAREAILTLATSEARGALAEAMNAEPDIQGFVHLDADSATAAAFVGNGTRLAYGSRAGCVGLADVDGSGRAATQRCLHSGGILSIAESIDGSFLVSSGSDNTLRFWATDDLGEIYPPVENVLSRGQIIYGMAISPNGRHIVLLGEHGAVVQYDIYSRDRYRLRLADKHRVSGAMFSASFDPSGTQLVAAGVDGVVAVWECDPWCRGNGRIVRELEDPVPSVVFDQAARQIAVGTDSGHVYIGDVSGSGPNRELTVGSRVVSLGFNDTSDRIVVGTSFHGVQLWDIVAGKRLRSPIVSYARRINAVAIARDSGLVAVATEDSFMPLMNVAKYLGAETGAPSQATQLRSVRVTGGVVGFATEGDQIVLYDRSGKVELPKLSPVGANSTILEWQISKRDGRLAVFVSGNYEKLMRWTLVGGQWIKDAEFARIGFSECLAVGRNGRIAIGWPSVHLLHESFSQDDRRLKYQKVIGDDNEKDPILACEFSPDGRLLAVGHRSGRVIVWNVARRIPVTTIDAAVPSISTLEFSPDGEWLVGAGERRIVILRQGAERGVFRKVRELRGHRESVRRVAFSPDGQMLASVSLSSEILLWEAGSFTLFARVGTPDEPKVADVEFIESGRLVVASGYGIQGRSVATDTEDLMRRACPLASRELTSDEWSQVLPGIQGTMRRGLDKVFGRCGEWSMRKVSEARR